MDIHSLWLLHRLKASTLPAAAAQTDHGHHSTDQSTSSQETCPSITSYCSGPREPPSHLALSRNRTCPSRSYSGISPLLPSDSYKYLTWYSIEQHEIRGSQLHCPRIRKGPSEEWFLSREVRCTLPPKKRVLEKNKWEIWLQENWEDCKKLNISFQDLGDHDQVENFNRILRRLIRVETLWLVDNSLIDLSAIRLPSCRILNMNKNYLTSFKQLPKIPQIQHLSLAENYIETLAGLSSLRCTPLVSLTLKRNPCEFHQNYRKQVFSCLPNLKILDGILKLPEDYSPPEHNIFSKNSMILALILVMGLCIYSHLLLDEAFLMTFGLQVQQNMIRNRFIDSDCTDAHQVGKDEMKSEADVSAGSWCSSECQGEKGSKDFSVTAILEDIQ
ncbi:uncharacterized protein LOC116094384 [Mastomys coucha]|uniref:uncharacterized protein LOC116094384 n=1 Tax=Mastomys coucha TaxID=35658 RepID=UPI001261721A|nr:uncharacterized protein LOC116094384 [Mastomys coucha]